MLHALPFLHLGTWAVLKNYLSGQPPAAATVYALAAQSLSKQLQPFSLTLRKYAIGGTGTPAL